MVGVELRGDVHRCASVGLARRGEQWLLEHWRQLPACELLARPLGHAGLGLVYD